MQVTDQPPPARLFYACDAISFTTMAAGPVSIHFVCGETRWPAGNCFATPVLVGRDATAAIVVNEMRETAVTGCPVSSPGNNCANGLLHSLHRQDRFQSSKTDE